MFAKTLATAALALAIAAPITATEAHANGQLVIDYTAQNADEANLINAGLMLYQIANGVQSGAYVDQTGNFNGAALVQATSGCSTGIIHQDGNGHTGSLNQAGACQSYGLFQFGNGSTQHVNQFAHGETGIGIVIGFD